MSRCPVCRRRDCHYWKLRQTETWHPGPNAVPDRWNLEKMVLTLDCGHQIEAPESWKYAQTDTVACPADGQQKVVAERWEFHHDGARWIVEAAPA